MEGKPGRMVCRIHSKGRVGCRYCSVVCYEQPSRLNLVEQRKERTSTSSLFCLLVGMVVEQWMSAQFGYWNPVSAGRGQGGGLWDP